MRAEVLVDRMDLLAAQALSLHNRADALERVANELRAEAGNITGELLRINRELEVEITRARVRRHVRRAMTTLRRPA